MNNQFRQTLYKVSEIKNRRNFVRRYSDISGDKCVDIWFSDDKTMYFVYVLTQNHIMWKYTFSFNEVFCDFVEIKMDLFTSN